MALRKPKISVGLPVYNGERFLAEAIESILGQTMSDFELVISDNASTDATEEICRKFARTDKRVSYSRNERNIGANPNFNRVVELSTCEYFKWAAHDDMCAPTYLEKCLERLEADPSSVLCHSETVLVDLTGRPIRIEDAIDSNLGLPPQDPPRQLDSYSPMRRFHDVLLKTRWCFEIFGVMRRASLLRTRLQENYYGTDKVILATLALMGPFQTVKEPLFIRRCHPRQSTVLPSARARALWSNPANPTRVIVPQGACLRGYSQSVTSAPLFPFERLTCRLILGRYVLQLRKLAALMHDAVAELRRGDIVAEEKAPSTGRQRTAA
jgi:hypothetical protein